MAEYESHTCQMCGRTFPKKLKIVRPIIVEVHEEITGATDYYIRGVVAICHNCRRDLRSWVYALVPGMTDRGVGADMKPELTRRVPEQMLAGDIPETPEGVSGEVNEENSEVKMVADGQGNTGSENGKSDMSEGKKRK